MFSTETRNHICSRCHNKINHLKKIRKARRKYISFLEKKRKKSLKVIRSLKSSNKLLDFIILSKKINMGKHSYKIKKLFKHKKYDDYTAITYLKSKNEHITCNDFFLTLLLRHFEQVFRHRKMLCYTYYLLENAFNIEDKLLICARLNLHDLSKLSLVEAIGYTIKFHTKHGPRNEEQKMCWEKALSHHYENNDHHPQHNQGENMEKYALIESIIDMIACHLERDLKLNEINIHGVLEEDLSIVQMLNINPIYLERYTESDREKVIEYISSWKNILTKNKK